MAPSTKPEPAAKTIEKEARFGAAFLRKHGLRLLLLFIGALLPLWGFAGLAEEVHEGEPLFFDEPILRFAHDMASAGFNRVFLLFSVLGYQGVVPTDILLVAALAAKRRAREGLFAGIALGGSALLNLTTKQLFARVRPSLWESIAPEGTYSFPSGHAMGSMTLAWVCVLLAWRTPWRVPVTAVAVGFTALVGLSRVYLGVHYPSDILAGWTAASVWAVCCFFLVFRHDLHPWQTQSIPAKP
jgi:membrane-associated phospholipid phosphatase